MAGKKQNINDKLRSLSREQANALSQALNLGETAVRKAAAKKATAKKPTKKK